MFNRQVFAVAAAAAVVGVGAAPSTEGSVARWDKPVLTVAVVDRDAWAGTDVDAALEQWSPAMPLILVDGPAADIVLTTGPARTADVGATARTRVEGSTLVGCRIDLPAKRAGADMTDVLTHELGHCLGLHHRIGVDSVMVSSELDDHLTDHVTDNDLDAVRRLYR